MGLGLGGKCGMFFLVTINTIFLLLGLGLLIVGIIMKVDSDMLDKSEVITTLNEVNLNGTLSLGTLANSLSIFIISLGVFILLVAALGGFGACCKNRCLLILYAIVVLVIFVAQCVAVGLWFTMKDKVENEVKNDLKEALKKYEGVTSTKEVSKGWDLTFIGFDCCGVDAVSTASDQEFSESVWWTGTRSGSAKVPASCCKNAKESDYTTYAETACTDSLTTHREKGCYEAFKDWLAKYQTAAIVVGVLLLVIEIVAVIFAFVICRAIGKSDEIV